MPGYRAVKTGKRQHGLRIGCVLGFQAACRSLGLHFGRFPVTAFNKTGFLIKNYGISSIINTLHQQNPQPGYALTASP